MGLHYTKDPLVHPIPGEVTDTTQIILKVTLENGIRNVSVVGVAKKTCRFRAAADYVYSPDSDSPVAQLVSDMDTFNLEGIEEFMFREDLPSIKASIPPPILSRSEFALEDYRYTENIAVVRSTIDKNGQPVTIITNKNKRAELKATHGTIEDDEWISNIRERTLQLFSSRPIWTNRAYKHAMVSRWPELKNKTFTLDSSVASIAPKGPWFGSYIRNDYDPTLHPDARQYQSITIKMNQVFKLSRGKRHKSRGVEQNPVEFDGFRDFEGRFIQVCDITDVDIAPYLQDPQHWSDSCSEYGWFKKGFLSFIRNAVRDRVRFIRKELKSFKITLPEYEQNEDEDSASMPDDDDSDSSEDFQRPAPVTRNVQSRVSQFMAQLKSNDEYLAILGDDRVLDFTDDEDEDYAD